MRRTATAAVLFFVFAAARAQTSLYIPPPPPVVATPSTPPAQSVTPVQPMPPGLVETPVPAAPVAPVAPVAPDANNAGAVPPNPDTGEATSTSPTTPMSPAPPDVAPTPDNTWLPGSTADLAVLNEVDGSVTDLTVPVGGQANAGDLQVSVQSCLIRPPTDIPDAAAYLTLQPAAPNTAAPVFKGWMVRSAPGASIAGNAGETFRIINCS